MIEIRHPSRLYPTYFASSVLEIRGDELQAIGITHIVFDLDETLAPRNSDRLSDLYADHILSIQKAGIAILIGSNTLRDISEIARQINARIAAPSKTVFKPRKAFFDRVVQVAGTGRQHILMVGDRIINDIIGANRAGLRTVLVPPFTHKPGPVQRRYISSVKQHQVTSI
jgi:hypothetical protein